MVAILWAVHPLQTESVTYTVQRAESLVGFFYLSALYGLIRGAGGGDGAWGVGMGDGGLGIRFQFLIPHRLNGWYAVVFFACLLGMASKEVMVSAPVILLLFDRTFLSGSFREAWRRRRGLYCALAGTWLLLAWLVFSANNRGGSAGFGTEIGPWEYLGTQCGAIVHYLSLVRVALSAGARLWHQYGTWGRGDPALCGHSGLAWRGHPGGVVVLAEGRLPGGVVLSHLASPPRASSRWRRKPWPSPPYLPLAAVVVLLVFGGNAGCRNLVRRQWLPRLGRSSGRVYGCRSRFDVGDLTFQRNADYRSELSIWLDTVAKAPSNARPHNNLAIALAAGGWTDEAIAHYQRALEIKPDYADAHNNLAVALAASGRTDEAIAHYKRALESKPDSPELHNKLGLALVRRGRIDEAIAHYQKALDIKPDYVVVHNNIAVALARNGRSDEAMAHLRRALALIPDYAEAHNNLGTVWGARGPDRQAIEHCQRARF